MKKIKKSFLASVLALSAIGVGGLFSFTHASSNSDAYANYHRISAENAKSMMDKGGVTIVDVRTPAEFEAGHIPGAILVVNEEIGDSMPKELPDKKAVLLIYCRSGHRSKIAAYKLVGMGYKNVYDFGGIIDWPYEVEK